MAIHTNGVLIHDIETFDENTLIFYVNGRRIEVNSIDPRTTLATYLRDHCEFF
jgi:xanthine dehydrogenase iron-sulfur cluster and FAD-binding subunit A